MNRVSRTFNTYEKYILESVHWRLSLPLMLHPRPQKETPSYLFRVKKFLWFHISPHSLSHYSAAPCSHSPLLFYSSSLLYFLTLSISRSSSGLRSWLRGLLYDIFIRCTKVIIDLYHWISVWGKNRWWILKRCFTGHILKLDVTSTERPSLEKTCFVCPPLQPRLKYFDRLPWSFRFVWSHKVYFIYIRKTATFLLAQVKDYTSQHLKTVIDWLEKQFEKHFIIPIGWVLVIS